MAQRDRQLPDTSAMVGSRFAECAYGTNGWQTPAHVYVNEADDPLGPRGWTLVAGTPLSYNNWEEILGRQLATITHIVAGFDLNFGHVPHIAIGTKHGNACSAAVGLSPADVMADMVTGDPRAIFGGLVMVNFEIDVELAEVLLRWKMARGRRLLDAVCAPSFTPEAVEMLDWRKGHKCRVLVNLALAHMTQASLDTAPVVRQIRGGWLVQPPFTHVWDLGDPELVVTGELSWLGQRDLILAWAIAATSNSNTITLVRDGQLLGNGVGQQDRVMCCKLAVTRATQAGHFLTGAVAASDSFFPFPDGPEVLIAAGVEAILATSGSVNDEAVRDVCSGSGVALMWLPDAKARGFWH